MSSKPRAYIEQARHNLKTAQHLADKSIAPDWAFFLAHLSVELALKAVLIAFGNLNPRAMQHQLSEMMDNLPESAKKDWAGRWEDEVRKMHDKYIGVSRYPHKEVETESGERTFFLPFNEFQPEELTEYLSTAHTVVEAASGFLENL